MELLPLQELLDKIENNYDPEGIEITIDKGDFDLKDPSVNITVIFEDEIAEKWTVLVSGYLNSRISFKIPAHSMNLLKDDPLSWEYNDVQASLYFSGDVQYPFELISDLIGINRSLYGQYASSFKHFNELRELKELITAKAGLLAHGPKKLLLKYIACLDKHGVKSSIANERPVTVWDGEKRVASDNKAQVLFIGHSYIIADDFSLIKMEE